MMKKAIIAHIKSSLAQRIARNSDQQKTTKVHAQRLFKFFPFPEDEVEGDSGKRCHHNKAS